jgi:hypothetical protein
MNLSGSTLLVIIRNISSLSNLDGKKWIHQFKKGGRLNVPSLPDSPQFPTAPIPRRNLRLTLAALGQAFDTAGKVNMESPREMKD